MDAVREARVDRSDLRLLLHLWKVPGGGWRASLRNTADGELHLFADPHEMVPFLEALTAKEADRGNRGSPGSSRGASGGDDA